MRSRSRRLATLGVVTLALVVAACTPDAGDPSTPTATDTEVTTDASTEPVTEEPTATGPTGEKPEAEPPDSPPIMTTDSVDGAQAFAWYFFEYWNYMRITGETEWFAIRSTDECTWCAEQVAMIDEIHEEGGWVEGEGLIFDITTATIGLPTEDHPFYSVAFAAEQSPSVFVYGDGTTAESDGAAFETVAIGLEYTADGFLVVAVGYEEA